MSWHIGEVSRALLELLKTTFAELVRITATPWHFRAYCESCGMGAPMPANLHSQLEEFTYGASAEHIENVALLLDDGLKIIDGIYEAVQAAYADASLSMVIEIVQRLLWPPLLAGIRRHPTLNYYYPWVAAWPIVFDTHLAENFSAPFSWERLGVALRALRDAAVGDHDERHLLYVQGILADLSIYFSHRYKSKHQRETDETMALPVFSFGWESHLPEPRIGEDPTPAVPPPVDETHAALPIWMVQRTFSVRLEPAASPFKLAMYDTAPHAFPSFADETIQGVTVVPVPANTNGPSTPQGLYVQWGGGATPVEEDLGDGWRFRVRTRGQAGAMFPLPKQWTDVGSGEISAGAGAELELAWAPDQPPPSTPPTGEGGAHGGVQLDVGGFKVVAFIGGGGTTGSNFGLDDAGLVVRVSQGVLTLTPSSRVLGSLIKRSLRITLDMGLMMSAQRGIVFEGGSTLDLYLAVRKSIGNDWLGASLSFIRLRAAYQRLQQGAKLLLEATAGVSLSFMKVTLTVDGIGGSLALDTSATDGNFLRLGNLTGDLVMPDAIGLKIAWGPFHGGGTFGYDEPNDRYWGAIELVTPLGLLHGVGFTEPRPGGGHSTYVSIAIEWPESPTFGPTGFGIMVAVHRRADEKKMFETMKTGALDALLFPEDPIANSGALVASLASTFPVETDVHVFGAMFLFSFLKGKGTAKLGFLFQFGTGEGNNRSKIIVALTGKFALQGSLARVLTIQVDGLGVYDAVTEELEIHADLRNSRLCGGDLVGGLVVFNGDPDPNDDDTSRGTFFSIGGYHPSYYGGKGPQRAAVQNRLALTIKRGNAITLEVKFYLALTPSAFHLGAYGKVSVSAAGFGIEGELWLDGLVTYDWVFDITVGGSVKLILFSRTVCSLRLEGRWNGASPNHLSGKVSFEVLWWTVTKSFGEPLSDEVEAAEIAPNLGSKLRAALADPGNYRAPTSNHVGFSRGERAGVWATPESSLVMTQKIAPLGTQIDRAGSARLPSPRAYQLDHVFAGNDTGPHRIANGEFAPGLFFTLDTPAALSAPATETLPAGFEVAANAVAGSGDVPQIALFDEIVVDRGQTKRPDTPKRGVFTGVLVNAFEAAGVAPLAVAPITVAPPRYAAGTFAVTRELQPRGLRRMEGR